MKSLIKKILLLLIFCVLIQQTYAGGFSRDFLEDNTLKIPKDGSAEYGIRLQNGEDKLVVVRIEITEGKDFTDIIDGKNEFEVSPNTYDTEVKFKISAPKDAKEGDRFKVGFKISSSTKGEGMIQFSGGITSGFDVLISKEQPKWWQKIPLWIYISGIIGLIIIVVLIIFGIRYVRKRKKISSEKEKLENKVIK